MMKSTDWTSDKDFCTDVIDPVTGLCDVDYDDDKEIICTSSGRGRQCIITEVPRIPHKYVIVKNQTQVSEIPAVPTHLRHKPNKTKSTKGRGRARQLKQYALNCHENIPGIKRNNDFIQPFASERPEPRILKPNEMFFTKQFGASNLELSFENSHQKSFGSFLPTTEKDANFDDEFPCLSSSSSSNDLKKLSRPSQVPSNKKRHHDRHYSSSSDRPSRISNNHDLKNISGAFFGHSENISLPYDTNFTGKNELDSGGQTLRSMSLSSNDIDKKVLSQSENNINSVPSSSSVSLTDSASQYSSLNDVYYSSVTSGEESEASTRRLETPKAFSMCSYDNVRSHGNDWSLMGQNVIQLDGLSHGCDLCHLEEFIASFGVVQDSEVKFNNNDTSSVRFRLNSADACDWAVSCLHDTETIFPDFNCILTCFRVEY